MIRTSIILKSMLKLITVAFFAYRTHFYSTSYWYNKKFVYFHKMTENQILQFMLLLHQPKSDQDWIKASVLPTLAFERPSYQLFFRTIRLGKTPTCDSRIHPIYFYPNPKQPNRTFVPRSRKVIKSSLEGWAMLSPTYTNQMPFSGYYFVINRYLLMLFSARFE